MSLIIRCSYVLIVLAGTLPSLRADDDKLVREGIELLQAGEFERALVKFKDAQIENPGSTELHFNIGLTQYKLERWEDAERSFGHAILSPDQKIERRAAFHLGNCKVKQGKYPDALKWYNRALELDPDDEDAKINRAWTTRKIKELAKKQKEQSEKQEQERRLIEKLGEIVKLQTAAHLVTRSVLRSQGAELNPTAAESLAPVLDAIEVNEQLKEAGPEVLDPVLDQSATAQGDILEKTRALVAEMDERIKLAGEGGGPGAPPGQAQPDPEIGKIRLAQPHALGAIPFLEGAVSAAADQRSWTDLHAAQERALVKLLAALNELLDELTRIIQDEVQLLKDTSALQAEGQGADAIDAEELRDRGAELGLRQDELRERTTAFARAVEQQLMTMQQQGANPQAVQPGQVPEEQQQKMQEALGHLTQAGAKMSEASRELETPELPIAIELETQAVEELVKARAALSPPQQQSSQGEQGDENKDDSEQDPQKNEGEQDEREESANERNAQQGEDDKPQEGEEGGEPDEGKGEEQQLSDDQAERMLERMRQRERDRRREDRAAKPGSRGRSRAKKDW